ncbi:MAG: hypothetical protein PHF67_05270 [Candidatus Nanoarchaeia archaeon]|nr:hypothetical protein [Candidatus Nanoarchaeia archaeon]
MTITLDLYLKSQPNFGDFLSEDVGLQLVQRSKNPKFRTYEWFPKNEKDAVYVHEYLNPVPYSCLAYPGDFNIDEFAKRKSMRGIFLPEDFVKKVREDQGVIIADKKMKALLEKHPELERILEENQPLWGILKFTKGNPTHSVTLEAKYSVDEETLTSMIRLAEFIAAKYDGLIWNSQNRQFDCPDPRTLDKIRILAFKDFVLSVDPTQFEWVLS